MEKHLSFFKFSRFFLLLRKDFMENYRRYIWQFLLLTLFILVANWMRLKSLYTNVGQDWISANFHPNYFQSATTNAVINNAALAIIIVTMLGIADFSSNLNTKGRRIQLLMCPATSFEKFISNLTLLYGKIFVLFPLALLCEELIRVVLLSLFFPTKYIFFADLCGPAVVSNPDLLPLGNPIGIAVLSFFVLGGTIWPKRPAVYTVLFATAIAVVTFFVNYIFAMLCFGDMGSFIQAAASRSNFFMDLFHQHENWIEAHRINLWTYFLYLVSLINLTLAYFRFKEMDINNRFK
ncbi:MAG: hypothetical protein KBH23_07525 [Bacteroidaceae bacterium]|nr:hypothetical protein [Bacteroidaceae bacterium]